MGVDRIQESVTKCLSVCVCVEWWQDWKAGLGLYRLSDLMTPWPREALYSKCVIFHPGKSVSSGFVTELHLDKKGCSSSFIKPWSLSSRRLTHSTKPIIFHNHWTIEIWGSKMEECTCLGQCSVNNVWIRWMDWSRPPMQIKGDMSVNMSKTE